MSIAIMIGNRVGLGASGNNIKIPFYQDVLFYLDGRVIGSNAVDRKNGWLFPITGTIDWDITQKIFPFSTLCTISAPANGSAAATAIQAKDVNNFWYASNGTANVIPFTMFYQNIDFADKCFCKHVSQTVDSNNVRITQAGITDVVLYNLAKTTDIAEISSYFGSEVTATAGAKYVDFVNGDNGNAGTFAAPYKTVTYAISSSANNGLIYCKTGTYSETATCLISRPINIVGIGNVIINSGHADYIVYFLNGNSTITGISLTQTKGTGNYLSSYTGIVYSRCYMNITGILFDLRCGTFNDCVLKASNIVFLKTTSATALILNRSYCYGKRGVYCVSTNTNVMTLNNSTIIATDNCALSANGGTTITANDCILKSYDRVIEMITSVTGTFTMTYCNIDKTASAVTTVFATTGHLVNNLTFDHCIWTAVANGRILLKNVENIIFTNNKLISSTVDTSVTLWVDTVTIATVFDVHGNIIGTKGASIDPPIQIGNESNEGYNIMSGSVHGNTLLGELYYDSATYSAQHILPIFYQNEVEVYNNFIIGGNIGIVFKTINDVDLSLCSCHHNIVLECLSGIVSKGGRKLSILNNTIYSTLYFAINPTKLIILLDNGLNVDSDECVIKNNILFENGIADAATLCYSLEGTETGVVIDYNLVFSTNNLISNKGNGSLAAWQALGYDEHVINQNPLLNNLVTYDMSLQASSPAIGNGTDLGASVDDSLSNTSVFSTIAIPVVNTEQQGVNWDIGAYIH